MGRFTDDISFSSNRFIKQVLDVSHNLGYIGFWHQGNLYRFATYTGAITERLKISDERVNWVIRDRRYRLEMQASRVEGGLLREPTRFEMLQRVEETMTATVDGEFTYSLP